MYARIPAPGGLYDNETSVENESDTVHAIQDSSQSKKKCLIEDQEDKPKNVSKKMWDKFQALQKRTDEITKRSTEKRIKHLQKQTLAKVQEEITHPDDLDILREHDVRLGPPNERIESRGKDARKRKIDTESSSTSTNSEWQEVKNLLSVNDHLKGVDKGRHAPKTQLELRLDEAVASGDVTRAEELSEQLATREFGKKIADAIDARNYLEEKKKEEESAKAKKKKKLHWGFEHKQRWETKGNM